MLQVYVSDMSKRPFDLTFEYAGSTVGGGGGTSVQYSTHSGLKFNSGNNPIKFIVNSSFPMLAHNVTLRVTSARCVL